MSQYLQMWKDLGLDIKAHDQLLSVLGQYYSDVFLSQKNRPEAMKYFDFVMSEVHGLRIKEIVDARAAGRKVIGSYCVFVPEEIILAADFVSVGLCAGAEFGFDLAEKYLPSTTCSLIKSAFGFKFSKVCPYIEASDVVVGENTCDGKKKAYEILGDHLKMYIMDMPQTKEGKGKELLRAEYQKFFDYIENLAGKKITVEKFKKAIALVNDKRKALQRLSKLRSSGVLAISGIDSLLINQVSFYDDPVRFTESVNKVCDEVETRIAQKVSVFDNKTTARLIVSGCPMAVPNWKLPHIIETSGAAIVGEESCIGERSSRWLTSNSGDTISELIDALTERYLNIDCAVFTPNVSRVEHIKKMYFDYKAAGVIHYSIKFCQPYQIESLKIEEHLEKLNIPVLKIETDYSTQDIGQLKTRIEAFVERITQK